MSSEQGTTYATFIADAAQAELARRLRLEEKAQRAISLPAAVAATFVALLALMGDQQPTIGTFSRVALFFAVGFAAFGMCIALYVQTLMPPYEVADEGAFETMLASPLWQDTEVDARHRCAVLTSKAVNTLREGNGEIAKWLHRCQYTQFVAAIAVVIALLAALAPQPG